MRKSIFYTLSILLVLAFSSCSDDDSPAIVTIHETFESGDNGWQAVFGSYPEGEEEFYELKSGIKPLPAPLSTSKKGFMLEGNNHSDALRMFLAKQIGGLNPNSYYNLTVTLRIASKYPLNSVGIGGSPGAAVHVVTFASPKGYEKKYTDPKEEGAGYFEISIIKDQTDNKAQADIELGNVGIDGDAFTYQMIERKNAQAAMCKTDANGKIWIVAGTWSGFEGLSTLYYDEIVLEFNPVNK